MAQNKSIKQKIEGNDSKVLVESVNKSQYCLYSYEAGTNSGLLIQGKPGDIMSINNYKNSVLAYKPIAINVTTGTYVVMGAGDNPTSISSATFISDGQSVFCEGASPFLHLSASNIKPYVDIIPNGVNEDLGDEAHYFGETHMFL